MSKFQGRWYLKGVPLGVAQSVLVPVAEGGQVGIGAALLDPVATAGAGMIGYSPVSGSGAVVLDDAASIGVGTVVNGPTGSGSVTLDGATLSGTGAGPAATTGVGAATLDDATLAGGNVALNPDIPVPYIAFVGAQNAHPTQATIEIPGGTPDSGWLFEFRFAANETDLLAGSYLGGGIYAFDAGASGSVDTGLASRPPGATTAAYARTIIGTQHSFWSPVATHGGGSVALRADSTLITADTALHTADES